MTQILKICSFLFLIFPFSFCSFSHFLETLDNPSVQTVGLLLSAYSNNHYPNKSWSRCEYCTNCPDFDTYASTNNINFSLCASELNILSQKVMHEYDYMKTVSDRYISEFLGFGLTEVYTLRRVHSRKGEMEPVSEEPVFLPKMNVTRRKLKLDVVALDKVITIPRPKQEEVTGEMMTWQMLAFNEPTNGTRMQHGKTSFKGWEGDATQTTMMWELRENISRKIAFSYMMELVELQIVGCSCIRSRIGHIDPIPHEEVIKDCRKLLHVQREEIRPMVVLSSCLTDEEKSEMDNIASLNEERHIEL